MLLYLCIYLSLHIIKWFRCLPLEVEVLKDSELFSIEKPRIRTTQKELIRELKAYSKAQDGKPIGKGNTTTGKIDGTHQILFIDRLGLGKKPVTSGR